MEPKIAAAVVKERARRLRAWSKRRQQAFWRTQVGSRVPALVEDSPREGYLRTRTRNYVPVAVPWDGPPPRGEIEVVITAVEDGGTRGRVAR